MINIYDFLEKYYYCPVCNNKCDVYAHFYNSILVTKTNNNYNFGSYSIAPSSFISKGLQYNKFNFGGACSSDSHSFSFASEQYNNNFQIELRWFFIRCNDLILRVSSKCEEKLYSLNIKKSKADSFLFMEEGSKFIDPKESLKVFKKFIDNEIFL